MRERRERNGSKFSRSECIFFCQNVDVFLQDSDVLMKLSKNQIFGPDC